MGIEDFSKFLDREAAGCCFSVPLSSFAGQRVAVDVDNLIYVMAVVAVRKVVNQTNLIEHEPDQMKIQETILDMILHRLTVFMYYNVEVICCFDTKPHPLKERIKQIRKKYHDKQALEYEEAKRALYGTDPLFRNAQLVARFEKACRGNFRPSFAFVEHVRNVLASLGFVVLRTSDHLALTGDAEGLAASLCINGHCKAGLTTDTDFHAYGGNLAIIDLDSRHEPTVVDEMTVNRSVHYVTVRSLEAILQQSQLSFPAFRDVCIMLGTDYNIRIPMVGPVKVMQAIRAYGNIQGMAVYRDVSNYNYHEVLPIFASSVVQLTIPQLDFDRLKFFQNGKSILESEQLPHYVKIFKDLPMLQGLRVDIPIIIPSTESRVIEL